MPSNADPVASIWTRPPRGRQAQPTLSREQIVGAAVEILDADGIDGLTMRRLGARLGSGATSIYWYVSNKDELLDLAMDHVMGEVAVPDAAGVGWRAAARELARGVRDMMLRHIWFNSLCGVRPNIGPNAMRLSDRALLLFTTAGFTGMELVYASSALTALALGSATVESSWRTTVSRSGRPAAEVERSILAYQETVAGRYPTYSAWMRDNRPVDITAAQAGAFEYGLERLLDGLQARLDAGQPVPREARATGKSK